MAQGKTQSRWGIKLVVDVILPWVKECWDEVGYDHFSSNGSFSSCIHLKNAGRLVALLSIAELLWMSVKELPDGSIGLSFLTFVQSSNITVCLLRWKALQCRLSLLSMQTFI